MNTSPQHSYKLFPQHDLFFIFGSFVSLYIIIPSWNTEISFLQSNLIYIAVPYSVEVKTFI